MMPEVALHASIFDALPFPVIVHCRNGIALCDHVAEEILGYAHGELAGKPLATIIHPDAAEAGKERRKAIFEHAAFLSDVRVKLVTSDGTVLHRNVHARHFAAEDTDYVIVVAVESDTERLSPLKACGLSVHAGSRPLVSAALEALPVPVIVGDEHRVVFATQAAASLLGATSCDSLVGRTVRSLIHPGSRGILELRRHLLESPGDGHRDIDTTFLRFDGTPLRVRAQGSTVDTPHGARSIMWIKQAESIDVPGAD